MQIYYIKNYQFQLTAFGVRKWLNKQFPAVKNDGN